MYWLVSTDTAKGIRKEPKTNLLNLKAICQETRSSGEWTPFALKLSSTDFKLKLLTLNGL